MKKISSKLLVLICALSFAACQKTNNNGDETTQLKIKMTDSPFDADEVNVDIREVKVNFSDDSTGWVNLDAYAGVYNLLGLQNGVDTLLAAGTVPTSMVKEIRFVLGSDNSIMIDSILYPLTIPSGGESGLKLKLNRNLNPVLDSILIDFDAALSVIQTGNGDFKLKPVLKIK